TKKLKHAIHEHKILAKEIADGKFTKDITLENVEQIQVGLVPAISKYVILGEEIALVLANFRCETPGCNNEGDLTIHHLINRKNKYIIPFNKYISQRHYFFGISVLCIEHHSIIDNYPLLKKDSISQKKIDEIRKKYEIHTEPLIEVL
ncbi:MAG: hypothetical protein AABY22_07475, partial [Nanoarchaeota archaeon]